MKIKPILFAIGLAVPLSLFIFSDISNDPNISLDTNSSKNLKASGGSEESSILDKQAGRKKQESGNHHAEKIDEPVHLEAQSEKSTREEEKSLEETRAHEDKSHEPISLEQAWIDVNPSETLASIRPKSEAIESIKAIEFSNVSEFQSLNTNDNVTLNLPDNTDIDIEVESNEFQNEGVRTWSGNFKIDNQNYPATFTFGSSSIFGFIGHPNGPIKIEGSGNTAWIYEVPDSHGYD
ncbi:hypothetical protein CW749_09630 [Vibrio sp. vnigr-6D03]|uniref:hypothetical protein n=1 Tax=Vibrio sp. vnigr-6D03 TaxID=2058088 RepID=UPI000C331E09|nr:hypothetical protein [Vibrio sp. vnigr-6D03]PKF79947.1 hypothetical protein CW749_09630 [Vibrio sp. vnigr-6D03]